MSEEKTGWTCYHCGEHFITHTHAKLHFGIPHSGAQPACLIKAEQGLVKYIRELELRLGKAMEEDSDTLRDLANQRVEKANAVSDAEELGYSRGLGAYTQLEQENEKLKADVARLRSTASEYLQHSMPTRLTYEHVGSQTALKDALSETASSDVWLKERDAKVLHDIRVELQDWAMKHFTRPTGECLTQRHGAFEMIAQIKLAELRASASKQITTKSPESDIEELRRTT